MYVPSALSLNRQQISPTLTRKLVVVLMELTSLTSLLSLYPPLSFYDPLFIT